MKSKARVSI